MRTLGVHGRVFVLIVSSVLITTIVVALMTQEHFSSFMKERFKERMKILARYLALNAELGIVIEDKEMLRRFAKNLLTERDVLKVEIFDRKGKVMVSEGSLEGEFDKVVQPVIASGSEESVVFGGKPGGMLGYVVLYYSTKGITSLIKSLMYRYILVIVALSLGIGLVAYFIMTGALVHPIKDLLDAVKKVSSGDLSVKVHGKGLPETEELAKAFNEMLESLERSRVALKESYEKMAEQKSLAELGKFSLVVAHEVKNPLGIIKGSLDILKKENLPWETRRTMINYIEEELSRLDALIKDFLSFSKPQRLSFSTFDLKSLLEDVAKRVSFEFPDVSVELKAEGSRFELNADLEALEKAFLNIVKNACEVSKRVVVFLKEKNEGYLVAVSDDGPGVPEELRTKIFEPFFTTKSKGTGLGLTLSLHIVRAHKGSIEVSDSPLGGACFKVKLPKGV